MGVGRVELSADHEDEIRLNNFLLCEDVFDEKDGAKDGVETCVIGVREGWIQEWIELVNDSPVVVLLVLNVKCLCEEGNDIA